MFNNTSYLIALIIEYKSLQNFHFQQCFLTFFKCLDNNDFLKCLRENIRKKPYLYETMNIRGYWGAEGERK